jgi:peptidyl-prolyl cis-trans isomerase C
MKISKFALISLLLMLLTTQWLDAQEQIIKKPRPRPEQYNPEEVMAYQGNAILTQPMIAGAFSRIPDNIRLLFIRDGAKVDQLVRSLLQTEVVAVDAELNGFAQDPEVQQRIMLSARNELAEAWLENLVDNAPEADYEALAREHYLLNPEVYTTEEMVSVTHILIGVEERSLEDAGQVAAEVRAQLEQDPSQFEILVAAKSDDPGKVNNDGKYRKFKRGEMVEAFENVAFAMNFPGEISQPVKTEYGYHIIRLDKKFDAELRPYEKVKTKAIEEEKRKHLNNYRRSYLQKLLQEPVMYPEGSVQYMAKQYFGENYENAPIFTEDGIE